MAITFNVQPGYQFSASERVTYSKLNLLGTPGITLAGTVDSSEITDGAVTTQKLASSIDINSKISDHNLALTKLAQGTHGQILYYDSNGDLVTLAPGTSGYFLKTNGDDSNPEWSAQAGVSSVPINLLVTDGANKYISTDGSGNIQWEAKDTTTTIQSVAHVWDEKVTNSGGGNSTSGSDQVRDLNASNDPDGIITSLATNQITLEAGTYMIEAAVPGDGCNNFVSWLYDTTGAATLLNGTSSRSYSGDRLPVHSLIKGRFTLTTQSVLEIKFRCSNSNTNGLGQAANISGHPEIYTTAAIYKFA
jgi:hypothetical protein